VLPEVKNKQLRVSEGGDMDGGSRGHGEAVVPEIVLHEAMQHVCFHLLDR
jgi:hypothetical protein